MTYKAYVDGSYYEDKVGYGAVLLNGDETVQEFFGEVTENVSSRQVAGELVAVMTILDYCQKNNIQQVAIYYDYTGIENWAKGRWKTNNTLTQRYALYVKNCPVKVIWNKVKSHSGDKWNDVADELAKRGTGAYDSNSSLSKQKTPQKDTNLLAAIGEAFATYLQDQSIDARFDSVKNNQYARLIIFNGTKKLGYFDLYDTKNRPLDPYLHGFKDAQLQAKLEQLWIVYKQQL